MVMQFLTCPHCGAGFATYDEVKKHGREAHRDVTPKQHDLESKVYPAVDFEQRDERDSRAAESRKEGTEQSSQPDPDH